jgi:group I intron endonuclease
MPYSIINLYNKEEKRTVFVYLIENIISGKKYIGITTNPKTRWKRHVTISKNPKNKNHSFIHRAIRKWGIHNFQFSIIESAKSYDLAKTIEIDLITNLKQQKNELYNLTRGGDGVSGITFSAEECKRRSARVQGENNYFYGKSLKGADNGHFGCKMKPHVKKILAKCRQKISIDDVRDIRKKFDDGSWSQVALSKLYRLSSAQIHRIVKRKRWKHVK